MSRQMQGIILAIFSAACFGLTPFFAKAAYAGGSNVATLQVIRFGLAAGVFWAYIGLRRVPAAMPRQTRVRLFLVGATGYSIMSAGYYASVQYISPSLAALLLYIYPALVALLNWILFREPIGGRTLAALGLALGGAALVLGATGIDFSLMGAVLALVAALAYATYIVLTSRALTNVPPIVISAHVTLAAGLGLGISGAVVSGFTWSLAPGAWAAALLGMGLVGTVLAVSTFFLSVHRIGSSRAAILSTAEPLVTVGVGVLLFAEQLSGIQLLGAALVLGSGLLIAAERSAARPAKGREAAAGPASS